MNRVLDLIDRRWLRLVQFAALYVFASTAAALGPMAGMVVDDETGEPIVEAIVLVTWNAVTGGAAGQQSLCLHVETATTDANGRFEVEGWSGFLSPSNWLMFGKHVDFNAYKVRYVRSTKAASGGTIALHPFVGSTDDWFHVAGRGKTVEESWYAFWWYWGYLWKCADSTDESRRNLDLLFARMAADLRTLAETPEQHYFAERANGIAQNRAKSGK